MLRPSMYQIIGKNDSYYEFVVSVALRAREIADICLEDGINLTEKPVSMAVEDFAAGKSKVVDYI